MPLEDKIEAVKKVESALGKMGSGSPEREGLAAKGPDFRQVLDAIDRGNPSFVVVPSSEEAKTGEIHSPVAFQESTETQKTGSSTDQEKKKKKDSSGSVDPIAPARSFARESPSSLMDEVAKLGGQVDRAATLTPEELRSQANGLIAQIETVKQGLVAAGGEIKPSYQTLLKNRLTHVNENLRLALTKAGVETIPQEGEEKKSSFNPIQQFLGYLTQSQYQIKHLEQTMAQVTSRPLSPATMLALQIKIGYVQQQIELFTSLLNKALESTKTIMNVQV